MTPEDDLDHLSPHDYDKMSAARLGRIARSLGIAGRSKMNKTELAFAIVAERRLRGLPVGGDEDSSVDIAAITEQPLRLADDGPLADPASDPGYQAVTGRSPAGLVASAKAILTEYEPSALK